MHSWFHLLLLFFSPCFFFILFDPKPMRKQHLDLWTSHMLFQWKRLQGEGRDSEGSNNQKKKKGWRLQKNLPQVHRSDHPYLRWEIWSWLFQVKHSGKGCTWELNIPQCLLLWCTRESLQQRNGRRFFRLFLCLFTNLFRKFDSTTKLDSWWQVLNCSVKEVGLWGLQNSCFGVFFPVQWEKLHQNINRRWLCGQDAQSFVSQHLTVTKDFCCKPLTLTKQNIDCRRWE